MSIKYRLCIVYNINYACADLCVAWVIIASKNDGLYNRSLSHKRDIPNCHWESEQSY